MGYVIYLPYNLRFVLFGVIGTYFFITFAVPILCLIVKVIRMIVRKCIGDKKC